MEKEETWKALFAGIATIVSWKLKLLFPLWGVLVAIMIADLFMGVSATNYESELYPELKLKVSSDTLRRGFIKKGVSLVLIGVLFLVDVSLLHYSKLFVSNFDMQPFFALFMTLYVVASELASIGENYVRHGHKLPEWFGKLGTTIENSANAKASRHITKIKEVVNGGAEDEK